MKSPLELKDAEEMIIHSAHREAFHNEYATLISGKPLPMKSWLIKRSPCLDKDGVIQCDSGLKFTDFLPYSTRFLIILPGRHSDKANCQVLSLTRKPCCWS